MTSSVFMNTIAGEKSAQTPIWIMRQAGRYLTEYRAVRQSQKDFISFCLNPEKASEVTLQPIKRFDFDAAIIFSDILMLPWALNRNVHFITGTGPRLTPLSLDTNLDDRLLDQIEKRLSPVGRAIELTRLNLPTNKALIGFAGAPWTVITYMIEGGSSRDFAGTRKWLWLNTKEFEALFDYMTQATINFLTIQARAGADVLMLFDSWASAVPAERRDQFIIAPVRKIVRALREQGNKQPIIGFPKGIGEGIIAYSEKAEIDVLAIDHMTDAEWVDKVLPENMPVQGNLDPLSLLTGGSQMMNSIDYILDSFKDRPHIFNLGHGITPLTPVSNVEQMVQQVRKS